MRFLKGITRTLAGLGAFAVLGLAACGESTAPTVDEALLAPPSMNTVVGPNAPTIGGITVCKVGPDGDFEIDLVHPDLEPVRTTVANGACQTVYTAVVDDGLLKRQRLLATEHASDLSVLDSIVVVMMDSDGRTRRAVYTGTQAVMLEAIPQRIGTVATFYNTPRTPPSDITICKVGTDGEFDIEVTHPRQTPFRVSLTEGECRVVYTAVIDDGLLKKQTLTAIENLIAGTKLDSIVVMYMDMEGRSQKSVFTSTTSVNLQAVAQRTRAVATFYNSSDTPPPENPGTGTIGYWKTHPDAWPVDNITVGGVTYTKDQAIDQMKKAVKGDATRAMFPQLVAAMLNVIIGNDASCIQATIDAADAWLAANAVNSGVSNGSAAGQAGKPLHDLLDQYNNGLLCAPHRG